MQNAVLIQGRLVRPVNVGKNDRGPWGVMTLRTPNSGGGNTFADVFVSDENVESVKDLGAESLLEIKGDLRGRRRTVGDTTIWTMNVHAAHVKILDAAPGQDTLEEQYEALRNGTDDPSNDDA